MLQEVVTGTNIIYWMMIVVGSVGVLAKIVNYITLRGMVKAAGNMQKSTHKLIKLVRSKYEHACMLHDRVENVEAFVEKYIYEYKGILFKIHTWRQLEIQTIWFSGILGFIGATAWYLENGFCEEVYRYVTLAAAEMVLLFVVSQLSDEQHKILMVRNYMVDYLENVCAFRHKRIRQTERERIDVIQPEAGLSRANQAETAQESVSQVEVSQGCSGQVDARLGRVGRQEVRQGRTSQIETAQRGVGKKEKRAGENPELIAQESEQDLSISIEGEPRKAGKGEFAKKVFGRQEKEQDDALSSVQEEAIRRILEEYLAE